jgi:hypothetical protein
MTLVPWIVSPARASLVPSPLSLSLGIFHFLSELFSFSITTGTLVTSHHIRVRDGDGPWTMLAGPWCAFLWVDTRPTWAMQISNLCKDELGFLNEARQGRHRWMKLKINF